MDSEKETPERPSYEESKPISIPGANPDIPVSGQYGLKQNFFDPNKSSPGQLEYSSSESSQSLRYKQAV